VSLSLADSDVEDNGDAPATTDVDFGTEKHKVDKHGTEEEAHAKEEEQAKKSWFPKPRGRPRKGMQWDHHTGKWVPAREAPTAPPAAGTLAVLNQPLQREAGRGALV